MFRLLTVRLLAVATSMAVVGCGNTIVGPPPPPDPPAAYRMEAALNEQGWKAVLPALVPGSDTLKAVAHYFREHGAFVITGMHGPNLPDTTDLSVMLFVAVTPLEPGSIPLGGVDSTGGALRSGSAGFSETSRRRSWSTDQAHRGVLVINRVDHARRVLEGRFEFVAVNRNDGSILRVKNGVFACKLEVGAPAASPELSAIRRPVRMPVVPDPGHPMAAAAEQAAALVQELQLR